MYTAIYESKITGGSADGNDPRDDKVLEHAKFLAPSNGELVRLEFDGELIWFRGSWVRVQPHEHVGDDGG